MKCRIIDNTKNQRYGICCACGQVHWYNIKPFRVDAYTIKYKMHKDREREKYAVDLLQPIDKHGRRNEQFYKVYGNQTKKQDKGNTK